MSGFGRCSVAWLLMALVATSGCGLDRNRALRGGDVAESITRQTDFELTKRNIPRDSAALVSLRSSYTGRANGFRLLVLVFETAEATAQALGSGPHGRSGIAVARQENVVMLLRPVSGDATDRLSALRRALKTLP